MCLSVLWLLEERTRSTIWRADPKQTATDLKAEED